MTEKRCPQSLLVIRILVKKKLYSDGHVAISSLYVEVATSIHGNLFTSEFVNLYSQCMHCHNMPLAGLLLGSGQVLLSCCSSCIHACRPKCSICTAVQRANAVELPHMASTVALILLLQLTALGKVG